MQATATTPLAAADPSSAPILMPATAVPARTVPSEAAAAAFAPEIAVLQRCAAWEQIVVEDESSFDNI